MPAPRDNAARLRILRTVHADQKEFARLSHARASQGRKTSPWTRSDAAADASPLERLATLADEAAARFALELSDMHATLLAMTACCEQSLKRLSDVRWVTFDSAASLVNEAIAARDRERTRGEQLAADLNAATRALADARQECRLAREQAEQVAARAREAAAAEYRDELAAARQLAEKATAAEARLNEELTAVRVRNQEIVDAQMLRLAQFRRELELASAGSGRARANAAVSASPFLLPDPPVEGSKAPERSADLERNQQPPEFDAIEAVLAGSPPVAAWQGLDG
jgi:hypothetical protein